MRRETFTPILYILTYETLGQAIALQNDMPQGPSSSIFRLDLREAQRFLGPSGSDCPIANVNRPVRSGVAFAIADHERFGGEVRRPG